MRILINVPNLKRAGGVSALFNILRMEYYYSNISLFILNNNLPVFLRLPFKYFEFIIKLFRIDIVHINPSLKIKSFYRDALYAWLSLLFSKQLIVYWHGWEESFEKKIIESKFLSTIAKYTFLKAHTTIVLGTLFERKLIAMGYKNRIYRETNSAENKFIEIQKPKTIETEQLVSLLFMSRLEVEKGLYIAIETLTLLNQKTKRFKLVIAGSGSEEDNIKQLAKENKEIEWVGYVQGKSKHDLLSSTHFMFLPSYSEGLPLSILEGMMYGLPIISRPIGGIPDVIKNGENGYLIESLNPSGFALRIDSLINNPNLYNQMSKNNIEKSKSYSPEKGRIRLYKLYENAYKE